MSSERSPGAVPLQLLLDSFVSIASEYDVEAILEQAVDLARLSTQARYGAAVHLADGRITHFVHKGLTRGQVDAMPHLPEGHGMLGAVLADKVPIRLEVLQEDRRSIGFPLGHVPMTAFLGVPVLFETELLGAIYLTKSPGEGVFTEHDDLFVGALARQTGIALEVARLIAAKERANEELRKANRTKSDFMSMVSHELYTPLAMVTGFATTMITDWDSVSDGEKRKYVEAIDRSVRRLSRMVTDLLAMSRIEAGTIDPKPETVVVLDAIGSALAELDHPNVTVGCDPSVVAVVDPDQLQQILLNLVANALKHGAEPMSVEAALEEGGQKVVVRVIDSGAGVPADFVPELFERFTRGPTRRSVPGVGLGLSIVAGLAAANHGEAWYETTGRGPAFCVRLPVGRPAR